jgi:hypothetical protein
VLITSTETHERFLFGSVRRSFTLHFSAAAILSTTSSCGFFLMQVIAHYLSEDVGYLLTVNLKNIDYNEKVRQDNAKIEKVIMDMFNAKEF